MFLRSALLTLSCCIFSLSTPALQHTHGRKGEAAKLLGWGRNTLTRKLKELADT